MDMYLLKSQSRSPPKAVHKPSPGALLALKKFKYQWRKFIMRKFKTSLKNRTTYAYYGADGRKCNTLVPGEHGITEEWIHILHRLDDAEWNSDNKQHRTGRKLVPEAPSSYEEVSPYIADSAPDPLSMLIATESKSEILAAIDNLPPQQSAAIKAVKLGGMSLVDYASMTGKSKSTVSESIKSATEKLRVQFGK
jgi:RNA polymerase sigma factor (sigma-70 family)